MFVHETRDQHADGIEISAIFELDFIIHWSFPNQTKRIIINLC